MITFYLDRRWEVAIIVRKLLLSIITKYSIATSKDGGDTSGSVRQTLCNLGVMLIACTAHVYAQPFAHSDANFAEMATLFSTVMVLLVGLGTMKVSAQSAQDQDKELGIAEAKFGFYMIIYVMMFGFVLLTLAIITRRVGGALGQMIRGAKREYDGIVGLPDQIAALINKDRHEAAIAWFNERRPIDEWNDLVTMIGKAFKSVLKLEDDEEEEKEEEEEDFALGSRTFSELGGDGVMVEPLLGQICNGLVHIRKMRKLGALPENCMDGLPDLVLGSKGTPGDLATHLLRSIRPPRPDIDDLSLQLERLDLPALEMKARQMNVEPTEIEEALKIDETSKQSVIELLVRKAEEDIDEELENTVPGLSRLQRLLGATAPKDAPYMIEDTEIKELMECIRKFSEWKQETGFVLAPT